MSFVHDELIIANTQEIFLHRFSRHLETKASEFLGNLGTNVLSVVHT